MLEVAETTPLFAWSGPFNVPMVRPELKVWSAPQVFALEVLREMVAEPPSEIGEPDTVSPPQFERLMVELASVAFEIEAAGKLMVPVAVNPATERLPEKSPLP